MAYLISEIFLSLVAAALIGGVAGWQLCRWSVDRSAQPSSRHEPDSLS